MRWSLLSSFNTIYTIDLHGNINKKEKSPDGSIDENVFDIQQGVSINLFIKSTKVKKAKCRVFHSDVFGQRESKYDLLSQKTINSLDFKEVSPTAPSFNFVNANEKIEKEYQAGFSVDDLFKLNGVGITTAHDEFVIDFTRLALKNKFDNFRNSDRNAATLHQKFDVKEKNGWDILAGYDNIKSSPDLTNYIIPLSYRPFDNRYIFYEDKLVWRTVRKVMSNLINHANYGLVVPKISKEEGCFFISKFAIAHKLCSAYDSNSIFPLYIYSSATLNFDTVTIPNLNVEVANKIASSIGLRYSPSIDDSKATVGPADLFDYIYALGYSNAYRKKYTEFLKSGFPRIPYPMNAEVFWSYVRLGSELRQIHLMESPAIERLITTFPNDGSNIVETVKFELSESKESSPEQSGGFSDADSCGKVIINENQFFNNVPALAWSFYIGGYQPALKWLKDRKGRELTFEDILHYQKIIVALSETDRIMKEIDNIEFIQ